jgi:DNA recombination protein RmuC
MNTIIASPFLIALLCSALTLLITLLLARNYWLAKQRSLESEKAIAQHQREELKLQALTSESELKRTREEWTSTQIKLTQVETEKTNLEIRLNDQKKELTDLHTQLYNKFEVMANQILDSKSDKFTKMNEEKIKALIEPLGKDIEAFKKSVQDESKERFSLANEVQKLVLKNDEMSEVAINLTKALKGESKTQGNWGEMILESLLEKSGLRKGEQYFMEHQLQDQDGQALRSSSEGKKMRPDAVIRYPDDRTVIVDSKVSLTAFSRSLETENDESYQAAIKQHVSSLKAHIDALSAKGYDDYNTSLDFVLMFLPSEPAYIAAMQADPELWNYAYEKRILLQSPTNLITSLKLIAELWKREAHNQNAQAIADRGAKLYDKFVGFVENLQDMGVHLDKAKEKYDEGFKQLSTGRGNLLNQAGHLKAMVGKTKKELPTALNTEHIEMEDELS